jgi:hypothetical protein
VTGPGPRDQFAWYSARKGEHTRYGFRIVQGGAAVLAVILIIVGFVVAR